MTPRDRSRLAALDRKIDWFAAQTGLTVGTVSGWNKHRPGRRIQLTPLWVGLLLDAWEASPTQIPQQLTPIKQGDAMLGDDEIISAVHAFIATEPESQAADEAYESIQQWLAASYEAEGHTDAQIDAMDIKSLADTLITRERERR